MWLLFPNELCVTAGKYKQHEEERSCDPTHTCFHAICFSFIFPGGFLNMLPSQVKPLCVAGILQVCNKELYLHLNQP